MGRGVTHAVTRQLGRADRMTVVLKRDGTHCTWCGQDLTGLAVPTTDHLIPKVKGGPAWLENEVAACRRCNGQRGHVSPADWLSECQGRGWQPDKERVRRVLASLREAIEQRGGQRRARQYLAGQLRRLAR
jgi:HNH endonuclease